MASWWAWLLGEAARRTLNISVSVSLGSIRELCGGRRENCFCAAKWLGFAAGSARRAWQSRCFSFGPAAKCGPFCSQWLFCNHCRMLAAGSEDEIASRTAAYALTPTAIYGWLASFQRAESCTVHVYMRSSRPCQGMKLGGVGTARRNSGGSNQHVISFLPTLIHPEGAGKQPRMARIGRMGAGRRRNGHS